MLLFIRRGEIERIDVNIVIRRRRRATRMFVTRIDFLDVLQDLGNDLRRLLFIQGTFLAEQIIGQKVRLWLLNVSRVNVDVVVVDADIIRSDITQIGGVLH